MAKVCKVVSEHFLTTLHMSQPSLTSSSLLPGPEPGRTNSTGELVVLSSVLVSYIIMHSIPSTMSDWCLLNLRGAHAEASKGTGPVRWGTSPASSISVRCQGVHWPHRGGTHTPLHLLPVICAIHLMGKSNYRKSPV